MADTDILSISQLPDPQEYGFHPAQPPLAPEPTTAASPETR